MVRCPCKLLQKLCSAQLRVLSRAFEEIYTGIVPYMKKAAEAFPHTLSMETPQALFYPVQALNQAMRERLTPLGQLLGLAVL